MRTPSGRDGCSSSTAWRARVATWSAFSPASIWTRPITVSPRPSMVATPMRSIAPSRTWATLPTVTGVPSSPALSTIFSMSASDSTRPSPRRMYCSRLCSM